MSIFQKDIHDFMAVNTDVFAYLTDLVAKGNFYCMPGIVRILDEFGDFRRGNDQRCIQMPIDVF